MKSYLMKSISILILLYFAAGLNSISAADYRPVLSGDLEIGDRLYTELVEEEEEVLDKYQYQRYWLKYKQKLSSSDYYYFKGQFYKKRYEEKTVYDNISLDFWLNYTHRLNDKLRNKYLITFRDKDYFKSTSNSYNMARLKYQLDYDYNKRHGYSFYIQRQWEDYFNQHSKDNTYDRISLNWDYKMTEDFELNTNLQFDRELYTNSSDSSNKFGKKLSVGFRWKL